MRILVVGGAGFIGSHIVDMLIEEGHEVVVIDNIMTGNLKNVNEKAKFYEVDIIDGKKIEEIFAKERPDYVFHVAAQVNLRQSIQEPIFNANVNIIGSLNILENCVKYGVKKIIFSSTGGAIYGDGVIIPTPETAEERPLSPYGISKLVIEKYLDYYKEVKGLDYVSLRYSNVFGPKQNTLGEAGVIAIFTENILKGKPLIINGSGAQTRDYVFVKDVAKANILALNLSGIFNVGTGEETSVNDILHKIVQSIRINAKISSGPAIKGEQQRSCLNSDKLISKGWSIGHTLDEGLNETVEYFKNVERNN